MVGEATRRSGCCQNLAHPYKRTGEIVQTIMLKVIHQGRQIQYSDGEIGGREEGSGAGMPLPSKLG